MGKTKRWFRALLGSKKPSALPPPADSRRNKAEDKNKKSSPVIISDASDRSGVGYSGGASRDDASSSSPYVEAVDANKHAIAVAAATAAVAEAALAAAKAAAEVVRMTSGGSRASTPYGINGTGRQREFAAVKIQSAFRAYLARRALRALKGLVKLQALVRGHIVRKQSSNMLRRMQAMARIQARACAKRAYLSDYPRHSTKSDVKLSWFDWWMEKNSSNDEEMVKNRRADDEKSDKILEIDTGKPHPSPKRGNVAYHNPQNNFSVWNHNEPMFMPFESLSRHSTKSQKPNTPFRSFNFPQELVDQAASSPQVHSVSSSRPGSSNRRGPDNSPQVSSSRPGSSNRRGGPFTSARSDCARSLFSEYMSHPNYMAETESSRAKFRSQSAPRQRMELERPGSTKMFVRGFWDVDKQSDNNSTLHAYFRSQGHSAYSSGDYGPRF